MLSLLKLIFLLALTTPSFSLDNDLKRRIDESLKVAKSQGLTIVSDNKCQNDCVRKRGKSLKDFINEKTFYASGDEYGVDEKKNNPVKNERVIFISKSLPKETLQKIAAFAKIKKVRLVLQGMVENSMFKTASFVEEMGISVDLDPPLFKKYAISHVPVFLETIDQKTYLLKGNVTPEFAFKTMRQKRGKS